MKWPKGFKTPWMSRAQLRVLKRVRDTKVRLWHTDISLSTIRSLSKRGLVDTRRGGRVVVTILGRLRLRGPWPAKSAQADRATRDGRVMSDGAGVASAASGEGSADVDLTEQGA